MLQISSKQANICSRGLRSTRRLKQRRVGPPFNSKRVYYGASEEISFNGGDYSRRAYRQHFSQANEPAFVASGYQHFINIFADASQYTAEFIVSGRFQEYLHFANPLREAKKRKLQIDVKFLTVYTPR